MNLYLFKREDKQVQPEEYAGFVVRAQNEESAEEMVFNEFNTDRYDWPGEHYQDEFVITLIASGVNGEPAILLIDFFAGNC